MVEDPRSPHVCLYDGVCGLCNAIVRFLLARDRARRLRFAALQSDVGRELLARHGISTGALDTFRVARDAGTPGETVLSRSRAVLFACRELGWPWRAATLLGVVPRALLDAAYDLVARHRYRWFGRHERCLVPSPEHAGRFLGATDPP